MPVLTISSVNTGTNQLTITAHGRTTGDGFAAVYSPDGGTLPAPLVGATDYWIIRDSADLVRLAASCRLNAASLRARR